MINASGSPGGGFGLKPWSNSFLWHTDFKPFQLDTISFSGYNILIASMGPNADLSKSFVNALVPSAPIVRQRTSTPLLTDTMTLILQGVTIV